MLTDRLHNHRLAGNGLPDAVEVVRRYGAVQAQDFAGALWALGQRVLPRVREADVLAAFDAGALLRTHVLRPTWHFVPPEDLRWMLALTGPRIQAASAARLAALELDTATRVKAARAFARALQRRPHLTRDQLARTLRPVGVDPAGQRLVHLLMHAELDGLICSGPRVGKHATYALVDARIPPSRAVPREEALATLMTRYFTSHGPATVRDAAWWSGLTTGEVRTGIALAGDALARHVAGEVEYWSPAAAPAPQQAVTTRAPHAGSAAVVHLLPSYDEYIVAYRDRTALLHRSTPSCTAAQSALLLQPVLLNGRHIGTWRRAGSARGTAAVALQVHLLQPLTPVQKRALNDAAAGYAAYLGREVTVTGA